MQADVLVCSGCVEGSMESGIYRRGVELCILFYRTVHKPPSSESTYGQKMLSSVEDCLMFGVVALTSRRVTSLSSPQAWMNVCPMSGVVTLIGEIIVGRRGLSSPQAWTSVVQAASIKLSRMDMPSIVQTKSDVLGEGIL